MTKARKRAATRNFQVQPISLWQTLNQPIINISEETAKDFFAVLAVALMAIWLSPYFGSTSTLAHAEGLYPQVAGANTEYIIDIQLPVTEGTVVPEWYYVASSIPGAVAEAFADAANDVLDISEPVSQIAEFYEPGVDAVWNAWTDLMMDPY